MLSSFFHPSKGFDSLPRRPSGDIGDFDDTPVPSLQPSMANMSFKKPEKEMTSVSSVRSGVFRHALLKTAPGQSVVLDRDLPVPPVLSRQINQDESLEKKPGDNGYENMFLAALPSRNYSPSSHQSYYPPPPNQQLLGSVTNSDHPFPRERVCIDPLLHPSQSHIKTHHRGLLKGADFCDTGVPGQPLPQLDEPESSSSSSSSSSSISSKAEVVLVPVKRAMTGDDLCLSTIEITRPKQEGHSRAVKVRPAFNTSTFQYPTNPHSRELSLGVSKVRPFDPSKEHQVHDDSINVPSSLLVNYGGFKNIPVSKTRPFDDEPLEFPRLERNPENSEIQQNSDETDHSNRINRWEMNSVLASDVSPCDVSAKSGKPHSQGVRRSRAGTIDYKRTAQWLRDLLKNPEYSTKLTNMPPKPKRSSYVALEDPQGATPFSRRTTRKSTLPPSEVDSGGFQKTFRELERLLQEIMALASQVADQEEDRTPGRRAPRSRPSGKTTPQTRFSDHSQKNSNADLNDDSSISHPFSKRAATFPNTDKRALLTVDNLYRNISLAPETSVPYEVLADKTVVSPHLQTHKSLRKIRSRQVASIPERVSSRRKSMEKTKRRRPKRIAPQLLTDSDVCSMDGSDDSSFVDLPTQYGARNRSSGPTRPRPSAKHVPFISRSKNEVNLPERDIAGRPFHNSRGISLHGKSHVSLRGVQAFSLAKSKRRQPIARDWSPIRKRAIATVACISTALIGLLLGIYAGLVPSLQYYIWDTGHSIINGNVGCFLGMALPTFFCWPLPLLHGRKPYITSSLVLSMPLLFPQALARMVLLVPRCLMGICLGFASMNFHSILTDLFGASLMSSNPHQEVVDDYDVRRHGGGMGVWLGIWTWCYIASLGFGFWAGAWVIDQLPPAWGFYLSVILVAVVLLLNTLCPEVRRSAFRRSVVEVRTGTDISRRVARGEVMMHRVKDGPRWWGQEMYHGVALSFEMLRQPGFAVMAIYSGWIYAQVVLIIVLLGSLSSRFYHMRSPYVGFMVAALAFGAVAAIPFQKASYFSRARHTQVNTSRMTFDKQVTWTSHLLRRTVFAVGLPLAGIIYTIVSAGPPLHPSGPAIMAAVIGFLSCLAISECNGIIMETFDTSDLQPGMTGRQRGDSDITQKKKNYSAYPRVTAGFAVCHTFGFIFAAGATALGGMAQRNLGQRVSTGVVAGILFVLTLLLLLGLVRFKEVTIIPECKADEMDKWTAARRESLKRRESVPAEELDEKALFAEEEPWRPFIVGNPTSKTRRVNLLELGGMSRFTEIRKRNKLIDANTHLNRAALDVGLEALDDQLSDIVSDIVSDAKDIIRKGSQLSQQSWTSRSRRYHQSAGSGSSGHSQIEMDVINERLRSDNRHPREVDDVYNERECLQGQTVKEESEESLLALASDDADRKAAVRAGKRQSKQAKRD
ncbi:polyamine transport protein [Colletotrichum truncatum]|uniref:Polyamine transport protein n=1 Tax=Colletotrichum truncatum TaxID=5467 RepID=A0ACC3ZF82_COLTU|nr:polyamine transport protein [Colletotrichum truncatum]KAF6801474.1 polyamine transport protein [Colletotrichum truncatum]